MGEITKILESLVPRNNDELTLLQRLLQQAQRIAGGVPGEKLGSDLYDSIPQHAQKYFHGLVEAVEIYQSIRGEPLPVQALTLSDPSVYELKQIRDMCLEDGLRSIY